MKRTCALVTLLLLAACKRAPGGDPNLKPPNDGGPPAYDGGPICVAGMPCADAGNVDGGQNIQQPDGGDQDAGPVLGRGRQGTQTNHDQ